MLLGAPTATSVAGDDRVIDTFGGDGAVHQFPRRGGVIMGHDLAGDISQRANGLIRDQALGLLAEDD